MPSCNSLLICSRGAFPDARRELRLLVLEREVAVARGAVRLKLEISPVTQTMGKAVFQRASFSTSVNCETVSTGSESARIGESRATVR